MHTQEKCQFILMWYSIPRCLAAPCRAHGSPAGAGQKLHVMPPAMEKTTARFLFLLLLLAYCVLHL